MLGKLLKYDLKWIYKAVVVFYILAFLFSVIGRGLNSIENSLVFKTVGQISMAFAVGMMISSLINCLMRSWARFVRNVYKDESYLTHTLPVKKNTIYVSKVLAAIICIFTTVLVIITCLAICYYSQANIDNLKSVLEITASTYNTTVLNLIFIISTLIFIEIVFVLLIGYVGIIIGHQFNNGKMVKSIATAIVLYMLTQLLSLAGIYILGIFNTQVMNLINTTDMISIDSIKNILYFAIGIYIIYIVIYYLVAKRQLERGVNVE